MESPSSVELPSPDATTAFILGASSSGWSPQRPSSKRQPLGEALFPSEGDSPHRSPQKERQSFGHLRTHNYVSNSVFTRGPEDVRGAMSPPDSPSKQRAGVGLGIISSTTRGAGALPRPNSGFTPRKVSSDRMAPTHHLRQHSDAENSEPEGMQSIALQSRKSKGVEILQKGSYVSNSPFRQAGNGSQRQQAQEEVKPLRPQNAWAMSAAAASAKRVGSPSRSTTATREPPATPERSTRTRLSGSPSSKEGTPRSSPSRSPNEEAGSLTSSPSGRGVLVSNRLHGPRVMERPMASDDATSSNGVAAINNARHERRKTVTFDEVLEVQEFDKESSFDRESTRSDVETGTSSLVEWNDANRSHSRSSEESEMWIDKSGDMVSNRAATPDRSFDAESTARSESEESFNKTFATAPAAVDGHTSMEWEAADASTASAGGLNAINRVESMVDELLLNEFLHDPSSQQNALDESPRPCSPSHRNAGEDLAAINDHSTSARRKALPNIPDKETATSESAQATSLQAPLLTSISGLPDLPQLSPIMMAKDLSLSPDNDEPQIQDKCVKLPPQGMPDLILDSPRRRVGGRPHISRDAVLERVALEKSKASISPAPTAIPASQTYSESRTIEPSIHKPRTSDSQTVLDHNSSQRSKRPNMPPRADSAALEARRATPPSPARSLHVINGLDEKVGSPLERLEAEVAAEQIQYAEMPPPLPPKTEQHEETWFARAGSVERDVTPTPAPTATLLPPAAVAVASGGCVSPSVLSPPPPAVTPAQQADAIIARRRSKNNGDGGRPVRRRSLSTNDATTPERQSPANLEQSSDDNEESDNPGREEASEADQAARLRTRESIGADLARSKVALDVSLQRAIGSGFTSSLEREISKIYHQGEQKYKVMDRGTFTSADDKITHSSSAGDVDSGKAWRKLRRPSDANEYAKEMREYRANGNTKKALGKLFVMIDSFHPANLPPTSRPTKFYCVLDNGLHMVKTGTAALLPVGSVCSVGQEFELIQHKNLEFSLTLMVQRDAHLVEQSPQSPASFLAGTPSSPKKDKNSPSISKGMSRFFSSPKKASKRERQASEDSIQQQRNTEPLLAYVNREGAFGQTNVVFEKVVSQCLGKCATLDLPVVGVADPVSNLSGPANQLFGSTNASRADFARNLHQRRGTLRLKLFYLPPTPSIPRNLLPESLDECIKGMAAAEWHQSEPVLSGTLTQLGGDCRSWRRRPVKIQGVHLICFNEITNKATVKIDLTKVVAVEETVDPLGSPTKQGDADRSPTRLGARSAAEEDELDEAYHVERSFRVFFEDGERISFFADTDELKDRWIVALRKVVEASVPVCPLWAQLAWDMTHDKGPTPARADGRAVRTSEVHSGPPRSASSGMSSGLPRSTARTPSTSSSLASVAETNTPERTRPVSAMPTPSSVSSRTAMRRDSNQASRGDMPSSRSSTGLRQRPHSAMPMPRMPPPGQHVSFSGVPVSTPSRKPVPGVGHQHTSSLPVNTAAGRLNGVIVPPRR